MRRTEQGENVREDTNTIAIAKPQESGTRADAPRRRDRIPGESSAVWSASTSPGSWRSSACSARTSSRRSACRATSPGCRTSSTGTRRPCSRSVGRDQRGPGDPLLPGAGGTSRRPGGRLAVRGPPRSYRARGHARPGAGGASSSSSSTSGWRCWAASRSCGWARRGLLVWAGVPRGPSAPILNAQLRGMIGVVGRRGRRCELAPQWGEPLVLLRAVFVTGPTPSSPGSSTCSWAWPWRSC